MLEAPRAPVDLQCVERGPTFASLRWFSGQTDEETLPDSSRTPSVPINSYTLIVTDLDADNGRQAVKRKLTDISPWKVQADGSVHLKVTDLKPDHRFTAEVYALSTKFGISDASNQVTFKTLELRMFNFNRDTIYPTILNFFAITCFQDLSLKHITFEVRSWLTLSRTPWWTSIKANQF